MTSFLRAYRRVTITNRHFPPHLPFAVRAARQQPFMSLAKPPVYEQLPHDILIAEERLPDYNSKHFYPANPGDTFENRYQLDVKLVGAHHPLFGLHTISGGTQSRRWLRPKRYVVLKFCNCDTSEEDRTHELDLNIHLSSANYDHPGRGNLGTAIEGYEVESSQGHVHLVLVFEPLREPLWLLRRRLTHQAYTTHEALPLIKVYIQILLEGIDYMHSKARVIHTDFKLDNIMVSFEDPSTIDKFVKGQASYPMARKHLGDHVVYLSHNNFGPISKGLKQMMPQITDFGLAQRGDRADPLMHPIQPNEFRAPEVLLGTGWSYSADIWNFGTTVWELLSGESLFHQSRENPYSPAQHLVDIVGLIGDIPPSLIERERQMRHWRWSPQAKNPDGKLCGSAAEFYGGPFLTKDGSFVCSDLIPRERHLKNELPTCVRDEGHPDLFIRFMKRMLCWIPEERATAAELLDDPWLKLRSK